MGFCGIPFPVVVQRILPPVGDSAAAKKFKGIIIPVTFHETFEVLGRPGLFLCFHDRQYFRFILARTGLLRPTNGYQRQAGHYNHYCFLHTITFVPKLQGLDPIGKDKGFTEKGIQQGVNI